MSLGVALALIGAATLAIAQTYPARPVRLVVPYPPGGPVDNIGRILAQALSPNFGQNVVVENRSGDGLFVYTDGITEALNTANELFSEERLEEALRSLAAASASEMVAGVMERVRAFTANAVQADDIAAMGLRFVK